eukprot:11127020-Lingulodinium_polyedra.AAC.1
MRRRSTSPLLRYSFAERALAQRPATQMDSKSTPRLSNSVAAERLQLCVRTRRLPRLKRFTTTARACATLP